MSLGSDRRRRGYSLIEVVVVMSAGATVLALTIMTLARLMDMRRAAQDHLQAGVQRSRLAELFRRDVWGASQADQPPGKTAELTLSGNGGQRIQYQAERDTLTRTVADDDDVRSRESFELSGPPRFELDKEGPARRVALLIPLQGGETVGDQPAGRILCIRATLARDDRFAASTESAK